MHCLVPGDFLAAVGGFAAEDGGEGAFGDVLGLVDGLAFADAGDEVLVFLFVGVDGLFRWKRHLSPSLGSMMLAQLLVPLVPTTHSPTMSLQPLIWRAWLNIVMPFGIFVLDGEVVEDVAVALAAAGLAAAEGGDGFDGVRADDPVHDVEVVDVLLDDVIAGEPGEVVPVADLPLGVAPAGLAVDDPDLAAVPVALGVDDVADGAVVDAADGFAVVGRVAALRAGGDAELFLVRRACRLP